MKETLELLTEHKIFEGHQRRYRHYSTILDCWMTFSVFVPVTQMNDRNLPILWWLSGLTCNDENFTTKAGAQRVASQLKLVLIMPDTSPRGDSVADVDEWSLGQGASFYLNATQAPWDKHYRMYDYLTTELPHLIQKKLNLEGPQSIAGHSMGGHGALILALRNPGRFCSVSAFSPIVNLVGIPWGEKALLTYLGNHREQWQEWDASYLLAHYQSNPIPMLISQGDKDSFLGTQLQPEQLVQAAKQASFPLDMRIHSGYDHSYYFVASFIEEHLTFHAKAISSQ